MKGGGWEMGGGGLAEGGGEFRGAPGDGQTGRRRSGEEKRRKLSGGELRRGKGQREGEGRIGGGRELVWVECRKGNGGRLGGVA